jgi:hypothetical protein
MMSRGVAYPENETRTMMGRRVAELGGIQEALLDRYREILTAHQMLRAICEVKMNIPVAVRTMQAVCAPRGANYSRRDLLRDVAVHTDN